MAVPRHGANADDAGHKRVEYFVANSVVSVSVSCEDALLVRPLPVFTVCGVLHFVLVDPLGLNAPVPGLPWSALGLDGFHSFEPEEIDLEPLILIVQSCTPRRCTPPPAVEIVGCAVGSMFAGKHTRSCNGEAALDCRH